MTLLWLLLPPLGTSPDPVMATYDEGKVLLSDLAREEAFVWSSTRRAEAKGLR